MQITKLFSTKHKWICIFLLKSLCISNIFCNFAAESCKDMRNDTDIFSLESTLSAFFDSVTKSNQKGSAYPYLDAKTSLFHGETNSLIVPFALDDDSTARVISQLKEHLQPYVPDLLMSFNMPLTYCWTSWFATSSNMRKRTKATRIWCITKQQEP